MLLTPVGLHAAPAWLRFNLPGLCLFKVLVGFDCPACGITRSVLAMLDGRMGDALRFHPAGPVVLVLVATLAIYLVVAWGTRSARIDWAREARAYSVIEGIALGVLVIGWVGKLFII